MNHTYHYHCAISAIDSSLVEAADCSAHKRVIPLWRLVLAACLCLVLTLTAIAATTQTRYGMWVLYEHTAEGANRVLNKQDFGISLPEQLGDLKFDYMTKLYVVPEGTSMLSAITGRAVYRPVSVHYSLDDNNGHTSSLSVHIGKTDQTYWSAFFGFNPQSGEYRSKNLPSEAVRTADLRGQKVFLFEKLPAEEGSLVTQCACWYDQNTELCISVAWFRQAEQTAGETQDILTYAEAIMDLLTNNRP